MRLLSNMGYSEFIGSAAFSPLTFQAGLPCNLNYVQVHISPGLLAVV